MRDSFKLRVKQLKIQQSVPKATRIAQLKPPKKSVLKVMKTAPLLRQLNVLRGKKTALPRMEKGNKKSKRKSEPNLSLVASCAHISDRPKKILN